MKLRSYVQSAAGSLLIHVVLAMWVSAYLALLGAGWPSLVTLWLVWLVAVGGYHGWRYIHYNRYYRQLRELLQQQERKYLFGSLVTEPPFPELFPLWEALVQVSRSVADEVSRVEKGAAEHRDYVEGWVHEIKTPIAVARLTAEQIDTTESQQLLDELSRIEDLVEQALYYARSNTVENDVFIREVSLQEPIKSVLRRHARLFIIHRVSVTLEGLEQTVFTDQKWLEFIVAQVLTNAVKYRREQGAAIRIWAVRQDDGVILHLEDNGMGISKADAERVFDKGFTGARGREIEHSTGMGLFLARKLCQALGHGITLDSKEGGFTRVSIFFPKGRLLRLK